MAPNPCLLQGMIICTVAFRINMSSELLNSNWYCLSYTVSTPPCRALSLINFLWSRLIPWSGNSILCCLLHPLFMCGPLNNHLVCDWLHVNNNLPHCCFTLMSTCGQMIWRCTVVIPHGAIIFTNYSNKGFQQSFK